MRDEWRDRTPVSGGNQDAGESAGAGPVQIAISLGMIAIVLALGFVFARNAVTSTLLFLLILLGLVMAHEAAHFFTAKAFGVTVHEFGFGFPPRACGKRWGETIYTINWLPIGGFVRLEGEEADTGPRAFQSKPAWQRAIVLVSGAAVNLVLPVLLFTIALMVPHQVPEGRAMITGVLPGSPAAEAGLQAQDTILAVGGRDATNILEASRFVRLYQGTTVPITVRRGGSELTIPVFARWAPPKGEGPTGISIAPVATGPDGAPFTKRVALSPLAAAPAAVRMTADTMILARNEVIGWFKGAGGPQFAGPVGIAQTTGEVARSSETAAGAVAPLLELAALLSINLGIMNLLPLPMLDGGRVFFLLIEVVRGGRRIAPEREAFVHLVGFIAFMALAVIITFADIGRLIGGGSLIR